MEKFLQRLGLKAEKVILDKDPHTSKSNVVAWFQSRDKGMLVKVLRLKDQWAGKKLKTFLMGFTYEEW